MLSGEKKVSTEFALIYSYGYKTEVLVMDIKQKCYIFLIELSARNSSAMLSNNQAIMSNDQAVSHPEFSLHLVSP